LAWRFFSEGIEESSRVCLIYLHPHQATRTLLPSHLVGGKGFREEMILDSLLRIKWVFGQAKRQRITGTVKKKVGMSKEL
jgi:hypothetical protein